MHLTRTYVPSADERVTVRAVRSKLLHRPSYLVKLAALAVLLIALFGWQYSASAGINTSLIFWPLLVLALLLVGIFLVRGTRVNVKRLPRRQVTVYITDDNLHAGSFFIVRRAWDEVYAAETETMFVFSTRRGVGQYLPKRVLSETELADLRVFLQGKLGDRMISVPPSPVYHGSR